LRVLAGHAHHALEARVFVGRLLRLGQHAHKVYFEAVPGGFQRERERGQKALFRQYVKRAPDYFALALEKVRDDGREEGRLLPCIAAIAVAVMSAVIPCCRSMA
jgi:hypothetical protein